MLTDIINGKKYDAVKAVEGCKYLLKAKEQMKVVFYHAARNIKLSGRQQMVGVKVHLIRELAYLSVFLFYLYRWSTRGGQGFRGMGTKYPV